MKRSEATKLVTLLVNAYPSAAVAPATSEVYERMLLDLDFDLAQQAIVRLIASSKWLPTVAEIRSTAADLKLGAVRPGGDAWADVLNEIRRVGHMGKPRFQDPIVADVVRRWGWRRLCCEGNDVADRARFIELYDQLARAQRTDEATGIPLPGPRRLGERLPVARLAAGIGKGGKGAR